MDTPRSVLDRVLLGRRQARSDEIPAWFAASYQEFSARVSDPAYPCYFGTAADARGELYFTFVNAGTLNQLPSTLEAFLASAATAPGERRNLTIFFEPDAVPCNHGEYQSRFWRLLLQLRQHDAQPWPAGTPTEPDDPNWEFAFAGSTLFVFCAAPSYRKRSSRNLGPGMIVLIQPRKSFFGIDGHSKAGVAARARIRERIAAWDHIAPHPDLGTLGDLGDREWKQYFLPDDNTPATGVCPFSGAISGTRNDSSAR